MDFTEIHTRVCPKDQSEVTLTILYTKATCSRVRDTEVSVQQGFLL